jgi:hypothetical protein
MGGAAATHFVLRDHGEALRQIRSLRIVDAQGRYLATSYAWPAPGAYLGDQSFFAALRGAAETVVGARCVACLTRGCDELRRGLGVGGDGPRTVLL